MPGSAPALDGEALPSEPAALREAVLSAPAVGRISPEGKRAVVDALADAGRYVAMVGDGVNDVPALKEARLAIAQGSGDADGALGRRPRARARRLRGRAGDGRRGPPDPAQHPARRAAVRDQVGVRGRARRSRSRFPTATFPLLPRQFTIASTVTIGIPAFVLALAPSSGPWRPDRFLQSVARFALPAGLAIGIGIIAGYLLARYGFDLDLRHSRTVATGIVVACGLAVVLRLEAQSGRRRLAVAGLCAAMALLFLARAGRPVPARLLRARRRPPARPSLRGLIGVRGWGSAGCSPRCACCASEHPAWAIAAYPCPMDEDWPLRAETRI